MGSFASKAGRVGPTATARRYPTRTPATNAGPNPATSARGEPSYAQPSAEETAGASPRVHTSADPSDSRSEAINLDASDPTFAANLRSLGPVQPAPTLSHTSTFNAPGRSAASQGPSSMGQTRPPISQSVSPGQSPRQIFPDPTRNPALLVLRSRQRLQEEIDGEFGKPNENGRKFMDVITIRQALRLRDAGQSASQVEKRMGIREGSLSALDTSGVFRVPDQLYLEVDSAIVEKQDPR